MPLPFDSSRVDARLKTFWASKPVFGVQQTAKHVFLKEIISDRYSLINGLQVLRDELQLAFTQGPDDHANRCGADLSVPTVFTCLAYTSCGDRINQGRVSEEYEKMIASRFAPMSEDGLTKAEKFSPAGGGTDNGGVLAHVTVAHQIDATIRERIYKGNPASYILVNIDLNTHVGCDEQFDATNKVSSLMFGKTKESKYRSARSACGAIVSTLGAFDENNVVLRRIRQNMGEPNYQLLKNRIVLADGTDITFVVAAAIIAVQGLHDTAAALPNEIDERGIGHLTASTVVNSPKNDDVFYLARATVFGGKINIQGFGTDVAKYGGKVVDHNGTKHLELTYDGKTGQEFGVHQSSYIPKA